MKNGKPDVSDMYRKLTEQREKEKGRFLTRSRDNKVWKEAKRLMKSRTAVAELKNELDKKLHPKLQRRCKLKLDPEIAWKKLVQEIKRLEYAKIPGKTPEKDVAAAEAGFGFRFPPSYRRFCLEYGCGWFGDEVMHKPIYGVVAQKYAKMKCCQEPNWIIGFPKNFIDEKKPFFLLNSLEFAARIRERHKYFPTTIIPFNRPKGLNLILGILVTDPRGENESPVISMYPSDRMSRLEEFAPKSIEASSFAEFVIKELRPGGWLSP